MSEVRDEIVLEFSQPCNELAAALAKAQGEIRTAPEDLVNPHFKSRYASHASVWSVCRQPLAKNGLALVQVPATLGKQVVMTTILMHSSGQWLRGRLVVEAQSSAVQHIGSAITYAKRYAHTAMVGIPTGEGDDDGNAAHKEEELVYDHTQERARDWLKAKLIEMHIPADLHKSIASDLHDHKISELDGILDRYREGQHQ